MLKHTAKLEEKARAALNLSSRDVKELEQIVGEIIATKSLTAGLVQGEALEQMEAMRHNVPKDQQAGFDEAIASMRRYMRSKIGPDVSERR